MIQTKTSLINLPATATGKFFTIVPSYRAVLGVLDFFGPHRPSD